MVIILQNNVACFSSTLATITATTLHTTKAMCMKFPSIQLHFCTHMHTYVCIRTRKHMATKHSKTVNSYFSECVFSISYALFPVLLIPVLSLRLGVYLWVDMA